MGWILMAALLQQGTAPQCLAFCDGAIGICVWWGPSAVGMLGWGEMVELVCTAITQLWGGLGAPASPSPWTASIPGGWHLISSWEMPASSQNIAGNVSLMRLKSAGSLANYLFMSVVDFHTSVPSQSCLLSKSMSTWVEVPWPPTLLFWV